MLKKTLYAVAVLALAVGGAFSQDKGGKGGGKGGAPKGPGMGLSSPDFQDGGIIPDKYTQAVPMPVSPALEWTNVPMNTESFVLLMHDPDTVLNKMPDDILHWMAFNIPGTARSLPSGVPGDATLPDGTIQIKSLRGSPGFMGPGNAAINPYHHYTLELFALDSKLSLTPDASRADVMKAMEGHVLARAVLNGRFKRSQ